MSSKRKSGGPQLALSRKSRGMSMVPGLSGTKQWEFAMKKFSSSQKTACKSVPQELPRLPYPKKTFPTGSSYHGSWNELGMSGIGVYEFPLDRQGNINKYKGQFDEGRFHGEGEILYANGATLKGKWDKGQPLERTLIFPDGLEYSEDDWNYCLDKDRRYTVEYDEGLRPAGQSYITATGITKDIPPGTYDTGDGCFDPSSGKISQYNKPNHIIRAVSSHERNWIIENCRAASDEPLGPCPFLYEEWKPPMLEVEDLPPPSVRTKTFIEEMQAIKSWKLELSEKKRPSFNPLSKFGRFSYHRQTTDASADFYSARQSRTPSCGSQAGDPTKRLMFESSIRIQSRNKSTVFSERTRSLHRDRSVQDKSERERSLQQKIDTIAPTTERKKSTRRGDSIKEETPHIFKREDQDDVNDDTFTTPQRNPNW